MGKGGANTINLEGLGRKTPSIARHFFSLPPLAVLSMSTFAHCVARARRRRCGEHSPVFAAIYHSRGVLLRFFFRRHHESRPSVTPCDAMATLPVYSSSCSTLVGYIISCSIGNTFILLTTSYMATTHESPREARRTSAI